MRGFSKCAISTWYVGRYKINITACAKVEWEQSLQWSLRRKIITGYHESRIGRCPSRITNTPTNQCVSIRNQTITLDQSINQSINQSVSVAKNQKTTQGSLKRDTERFSGTFTEMKIRVNNHTETDNIQRRSMISWSQFHQEGRKSLVAKEPIAFLGRGTEIGGLCLQRMVFRWFGELELLRRWLGKLVVFVPVQVAVGGNKFNMHSI